MVAATRPRRWKVDDLRAANFLHGMNSVANVDKGNNHRPERLQKLRLLLVGQAVAVEVALISFNVDFQLLPMQVVTVSCFGEVDDLATVQFVLHVRTLHGCWLQNSR